MRERERRSVFLNSGTLIEIFVKGALLLVFLAFQKDAHMHTIMG